MALLNDIRFIGGTLLSSSSQGKSSSQSDPLSLVVRWVLCDLAILFGGLALMRFPPRMVVNVLGVTATRGLGVGVLAFGLLYGYAVKVNPVTQRFLNGRTRGNPDNSQFNLRNEGR